MTLLASALISHLNPADSSFVHLLFPVLEGAFPLFFGVTTLCLLFSFHVSSPHL